MKTDGRTLAMGLGAMVCWAVSPLTVRFLSGSYTVLAQAFWRYLFSLAMLWIWSGASLGPWRFSQAVRQLAAQLPQLLLVALANFAFQLCFNLVFNNGRMIITQTGGLSIRTAGTAEGWAQRGAGSVVPTARTTSGRSRNSTRSACRTGSKASGRT
jgi:hypothetical protein